MVFDEKRVQANCSKNRCANPQFSVYFPIHQVLQSQNTGNGAVTHIERVAMAPTSPRSKKGGVAPPAGYGSIPSGPNAVADEMGDGSFQQYLETFGMKMESDPYRLDIAKFVLVSLIVAGNFVHPFAQLGNKVACVMENFVSIINVPAYVMLTGYMSATTNKTRRRYIIAHLLIPYLIVQSIYITLYVALYWNNSFRSSPNGVDRKPGMFTDNWTPQPHWNGLSMMTPVMDCWYLIALVGWTMWRPYATELRRTVLVHVVFGCLIGFSPLERFMSIHRTIAMMPYFLFGHMLRRNKVFIPPATTNAMRAAAAFVLCVVLAGVTTAVYAFGWRSNGVWEQQISYHVTWETKYRWGPLIQLFAYLTTTVTMTAFFALVPPASTAGVRDLSSSEGHKGDYMNVKEKDVAQIGGMKYTVGSPDDVEEELGAAGDPLLVRGRRMNDAAERDQIKPDEQGGGKNWSAIYYLRVSKWGARSLCPLIFNFLVMIILEVCTYYNDTWTRSSNSVWVTSHCVISFFLAFVVTTALATRPACMLFGWILCPPVNNDWIFEDADVATLEDPGTAQ